jgi:multicomponent Na+:H+ antiporter subunit F
MEVGIVKAVLYAASALYLIAVGLYLLRVFRGPTVPDMVLAVDALSYDLVVFVFVLSIILDAYYLAVVSLPLALWIYILDIYVSKYLEKRDVGG